MEPALGWRHQHLLELTSAKVDGFCFEPTKKHSSSPIHENDGIGRSESAKMIGNVQIVLDNMGIDVNGIFSVKSYVRLFQNCEGSLKIAKNSAASSVKHR